MQRLFIRWFVSCFDTCFMIPVCGTCVTPWHNGLGHQTCDQTVVGSIPGRAAIELPMSTQPFILLG